MSAEFVHLHVHSEYSLLDGLPHPRQLAERARECGQPALAITDHGTMFAAIEFHDAVRKVGLKPIIGIETYMAPRGMKDRDARLDRSPFHLVLLAQDETGYKNLLKLASAAQLDGFYYYPRIDKELLTRHAEGIIATSGCLAAEVPQLILSGRMSAARDAMAWYRDVFKGRYYVELQNHGLPELQKVNAELLNLARDFELKLVATNDVHYLNPDDWAAQDILLCIQTGKTVTTPDRMRMAGHDYYFKSSEEMATEWSAYPEALANTLEVAERCTLDLTPHGYHLPYFPVPEGHSPESYLRGLVDNGVRQRYGDSPSDTVRERIAYELNIIHSMGFDTYFLIVWDLTSHARESGIWYNVRGSAAGSLVAYCLGITNLDPFDHHLIFERFLNPGRISMPDIDLDFPDDQRDLMIQYTVGRYGRENVAQIITFGKLLAKAAIRDVGRALDYPLSEVDRAAKMIPVGPGQTIEGSLESIPEFRELVDTSEYMKKLVDNARLLEGVARHASTHAAGVVVTDRPVVEYVPLHRATRNESGAFPVTQYPMGDLEHIGLLKIDFLGLATISIMRRACELIKQRYGVEFDLKNIPVEDDEAFALLSRGDVAGVFQVEGAGMRRVLTNMRPSKFDHIVATVALFRPGPMEYIETYIRRLHGQEPVEYKHPKLKEILEETYGIIVYQEQIIRIASELAGYKPGDADDIRKAVGKKIRDKIEGHRAKFVQGAVANGIEQPVAEAIYGDIEYFARYGFNKAHAADYAVLTCQTAYLKAHYPLEYMTALLSTEIGNIDKIAMLVSEARRMGIPILAPDIRYSDVDFVIDDGEKGIRFGLSAIKNVGTGAAELIVKARKDGGPFKSLDDFCQRADLRLVNRRVLESLVKAGAFHGFGHRSQILQVIDRMISASQNAHTASSLGQMSFFGAALHAETFAQLPPGPEMDNRVKLENEKELMGVYFSEHPLLRLAAEGRPYVTAFSDELNEEMEKHEVTLGGIITSVRAIQTKKGDTMAFVQLEDPHGAVEVTAFPRVYSDARELMRDDSLVLVKGKVQIREKKVTILADSIKKHPLADKAPVGASSSEIPAAAQTGASARPEMPRSPVGNVSVENGVRSGDWVPGLADDWLPPPEDLEDEFVQSAGEQGDAVVDQAASQTIGSPQSEPGSKTVATVAQPEPPVKALPAAYEPAATKQAAPILEFKLGNGISIPSKKAENGARPGFHGTVNAQSGGDREALAPRQQFTPRGMSGNPTRTLKVRVTRSNDAQRDVERLRELVKVLRSVQGRDRFYLVVCGVGGDVELDFPNFVTDYDLVAHELGELIQGWGETSLSA